jgi:signal transduction histidine kinase
MASRLETPAEVAAHLCAERRTILTEWSQLVRQDAEIPQSQQLNDAELLNHLSVLFDRIVMALRQFRAEGQDARTAGEDTVRPDELETNVEMRLSRGYTLAEAIKEHMHLRNVLVDHLTADDAHAAQDALRLVHSALDRAVFSLGQAWEKQAMERADQAEAWRERFIGILGHDLRNPLSAIKMSAELVLRFGDAQEHRLRAAVTKYLSRIVNNADRMNRMIADILDFACSRSGSSLPINPQETDLQEVVETVIDDLQVTHPERRFSQRVSGDVTGLWDRDRIFQVVANLVTNAVTYSPENTPVDIELVDMGADVQLTVHNGGPAIADAEMRWIFDPFKRGKQADAGQRKKGMGLGLYIVKSIATAHGGTIGVASSDEAGTTFTVRLPRRASSREAAGAA